MWRRRLTEAREADERGSSVVTFAILAPVIVTLILAVVQVAIVGHVRHVATLAATAGAAEAAAFDGSESAGRQRAQAQLDGASGWVENPSIAATRTATEASVTISANAHQILPFGDWSVEVNRTQPVERPQQ